MALVKCEECGNEVSDKAASCPKCGAPVVVSDQTPVAPERVTFANGEFNGTRAMLVALAAKAVQAVRYKVDRIDEAAGTVAFTTGMTMGSWSGVSGTILISEIRPFVFDVTGGGKQNVRGGQLIALDLFGEAKSKVEKVLTSMRYMATNPTH